MGKKKNKKKASIPTTPQSSTTQSSTPSVEDETQQLLRGGASASRVAYSSKSTEKAKGSDKKASSGKPLNLGATSRNAPESGHFPGSLDVPDEERGAVGPKSPSKCNCANKEVHQPECPELKKLEDARNKSPNDKESKNPTGSKSSSSRVSSVPEDGARSSSSSDPSVGERFRNAPRSECPERNLLAVPEQRSDPVSPSKRSPIREGFEKLRKKFSPKRFSSTECNCEDKKVHQPDCLYLKPFEADDQDKPSRKSPSKSKNSSGNVSSKKTKDGAQSSISSDPSVKEYLRSDPHSEQSAEKTLLTVPEQGSGPVSPSKKSPIREGYERLRKKFSPNRSSGTEDRTNPEVEQKKQMGAKNKSRKGKLEKNQSKSETSSSTASPIITKKNKDSETSNVSSKHFGCSKSPSASDRNAAEYSSPNRGSKNPGCPVQKRSSKSENTTSSNPTDYDPEEGTSRGPAHQSPQKVKSKGSGGCKYKPLGGEEKFSGFWRKFVKDMGEEVSEDMVPIIKHMEEEDPEENQQAQSCPIPRRRSKSFVSCRLRIFIPGANRPSSPIQFDPNTKLNIKDKPIQWNWFEEVKRKAARKAAEKAQKRGKAAAVPEDPAVFIKRNSADDFERTSLRRVPSVKYKPSVKRFVTSSPVRLRKCKCEGPYVHKMSCSRVIDARRRRKRRRCRQDI